MRAIDALHTCATQGGSLMSTTVSRGNSRIRRRAVFATFAVAALGATAPSSAALADGDGNHRWGRPSHIMSMCTGIRGNGNRIFAHFGSLARIVEYWGPVRCAAGGSSGSITTFLIDSVNRNPALERCGRRQCRGQQINDRHALMYRSMAGLTEVGIGADIRLVVDLVQRVQAADIESLLAEDPGAAVTAFSNILADFGNLINPEVIQLLAQSPDPAFHVRDLITGLQNAASFNVPDSTVFVRPGVINFSVLVDLFGRIGDFYAGYAPAGGQYDRAGVQGWLDACATPSRGTTWVEAAALPGPNGLTCGQAFADLYRAYETAHRAGPPQPSRLDEPIGDRLPMIAVTGVLTGAAIDQWNAARAQYFAAQPVSFAPSFDDVRFGYFGAPRDLERIDWRLERRYPDDAVTEKYFPLGPASWREVLGSSPAEPGLSAAVPLTAGVLSVGGWADPLRVQVLDSLGARRVITVNRRGGEQLSGFTPRVSVLLGATSEDLSQLYGLDNPRSSFVTGLTAADGVWCTDWDTPDGFDPAALFADGFNAPMLTDDPLLLRYPGSSPDLAIAGCTPGILPAE
jgi:hypothetical protein